MTPLHPIPPHEWTSGNTFFGCLPFCQWFVKSFSFTSKMGTKRPEVGELFRKGDRSVSQDRRRLRDRLIDDRNAQDIFKGFLGKCTD